MNIHGLQVSSSSLRDILRLERSLSTPSNNKKKKPNLIWQLHVLFQSQMQPVFSRCGFLSAAVSLEHIGISYLWKLSANSSKCFTANGETELRYQDQLNSPPLGWRKTYSCCILTPMPWARLHPTISPSLKRKRIICYSFILSKLVYPFYNGYFAKILGLLPPANYPRTTTHRKTTLQDYYPLGQLPPRAPTLQDNYPQLTTLQDDYPPDNYPQPTTPGQLPPVNYPPDNYPPVNYPPDNYPPVNYPLDNYPLVNYPAGQLPPANYPPDNYPPVNYPPDNNLPANYPPDNYPPVNYPWTTTPSQLPPSQLPPGLPGGQLAGGMCPDTLWKTSLHEQPYN